MKKIIFGHFILVFALVMISCEDPPMPKPSGYYRIELPERKYEKWENDCPFTFKKSSWAKIEKSKKVDKPCYFDLTYPDINATFYLSYLPVNGDLKALIDQEYTMKEKHNAFSTGTVEGVYRNPEKRVNAMRFEVKGQKAATPLQFFVTDSVNHFFRGTLYFYNSPNNDSLAPVITYLKEDLDSLIETFEWK